MKNHYSTFQSFIISIILLIIFSSASGQIINENMATSGELTFTVKTVTDNGNFAPKHVLAIWIEDEQGFVKTSKLRANQRKQYLYTWRSVSNDNIVDAVTGATQSSHQTHTIIWNCTDVDGNVVPDGDYTIYVEFTEKHAQGPITSTTFTKGTEEQHLTPADENNFINMSLDFIPETTGIKNPLENNLQVYPNPGNGLFTISLPSNEAFTIKVFNSTGKQVLHEESSSNTNQYTIDLSNLNSGIYFVETKQLHKTSMVKIVKQ